MSNPQNSSRQPVYKDAFTDETTVSASQRVVGVGMPNTSSHSLGATTQHVTGLDFNANAKAFRRVKFKKRSLKYLAIFGVSLIVIVIILGLVGMALNKKYAGRALPYTYVGNISVGGLTAAEIKSALDERAKDIRVTFVEGGNSYSVPLSQLDAKYNTEQASQDALVSFNPFKYLNKRTLAVPAEVNENYVDGYLRLHVVNMQTKSVNAQIVKGEESIEIKPEVIGFRTSTSYVVEQLNEQLPKLEDPVINLAASTEHPSITGDDLSDDIERAKALIATEVGIKVWSTTIKPSLEDKISWLQLTENESSTEVQVGFDRNKVNYYVAELAKKHNHQPEAEEIVTNEDGSQYIKQGVRGQRVKNVSEVASRFYNALISQQTGVFAFEFEHEDFFKISREGLVLATVPEVEEAEDEAETLDEDTTTEDDEEAEEATTEETTSE